jgi:hypothetical protein
MDVINNSTIDTVIDFANVKFGMELTKDQVSEQLRNLSFSETLKLINSIKADDNDAFSEIMDLSAVSENAFELDMRRIDEFDIQQLDEGKVKILKWVWEKIWKGKQAATPIVTKTSDKVAKSVVSTSTKVLNNPGKTLKWFSAGLTFTSLAEVFNMLTDFVGGWLDAASVDELGKAIWKHKLPVAAVIAAIYGGKKLKDYMTRDKEKEKDGNTTVNNYYAGEPMGEPIMAGEDTSRLKKLAGIKEAPADVYSTETPHGDDLQDSTMHGLMDKIEDYYHAETGDDMLDVQIGDNDVYIGNDHFSIYKNSEDLGYDLGNELEKEDISLGRGPYQHRLQGDDFERSKTMTADQIKVLAGVTEEKVVEGPDYRLQAQRETMNLSDQAILELVASLYEKLDKLGHREETDAEYFDDLYKRHPNESEEELKEIGYGTAATAQSSRATVNKQNSNVANRRYNITVQDQNRDAKGIERTVAGGVKQATGQGAVRAGSEDPDDIERAHNSNQSNANAEQANMNAQEIERLKQLAMGG